MKKKRKKDHKCMNRVITVTHKLYMPSGVVFLNQKDENICYLWGIWFNLFVSFYFKVVIITNLEQKQKSA